jgi:hypothetical protein
MTDTSSCQGKKKSDKSKERSNRQIILRRHLENQMALIAGSKKIPLVPVCSSFEAREIAELLNNPRSRKLFEGLSVFTMAEPAEPIFTFNDDGFALMDQVAEEIRFSKESLKKTIAKRPAKQQPKCDDIDNDDASATTTVTTPMFIRKAKKTKLPTIMMMAPDSNPFSNLPCFNGKDYCKNGHSLYQSGFRTSLEILSNDSSITSNSEKVAASFYHYHVVMDRSGTMKPKDIWRQGHRDRKEKGFQMIKWKWGCFTCSS